MSKRCIVISATLFLKVSIPFLLFQFVGIILLLSRFKKNAFMQIHVWIWSLVLILNFAFQCINTSV